ncbi:hypothetical protein [Curtobacterium flaccumfaciens]|uniref:hypothetical protein n=1 Tax=Curtobacterium flaccumfaciens TaxID=2035 RepID=UPI00399530E0
MAGDDQGMDELLSGTEAVEAPRHTAARAAGLVAALVGIGAVVAVAVTSGVLATIAAVVRAAIEHWADQY